MRVLWLSHLLPFPPKGGVQQRSYHLLREAGRRHEVHFVGLAQRAHQRNSEELEEAHDALTSFCKTVKSFWIPADARIGGRPLLLARSLLSPRPYDSHWLASRDMRSHLESLSIEHDLVHVDTIGLCKYIEQTWGASFILNHHNIESQMMSDRADKETNLIKKLYMRREAMKLENYEREWAQRACLNLLVSQLDERRLLAQTGDVRTEVVRNGVDVDYFQPRTPLNEHDGTLIFVGGMSWWPNRDAVLWFIRDIWPVLQQADLGRPVTFIGRDPPLELLEVAQNGQVQAPGFVDDIRPAVDKAFAYICPIRKGGGTRLKILDALAMAKPLVATSFAVEGLGLEDGIHYLRADRPEDYVEQLERLSSKPELRNRLARNGRRLVVDKFAWRVIGDDLERAYRNALKR